VLDPSPESKQHSWSGAQSDLSSHLSVSFDTSGAPHTSWVQGADWSPVMQTCPPVHVAPAPHAMPAVPPPDEHASATSATSANDIE
jgi:hypothetical protein